MACKKDHSKIQKEMSLLNVDQGGRGRHKCAACAYEKGLEDGYNFKEKIDLTEILDSLEESQAMNQRHKSPHEAYVMGYRDGVLKKYQDK